MEKIKIEKLVFGGQGLGRFKGKACFVWNALAGEEVEVEIIKNKKDFCEATAVKILQASAHRIAPREDHYLSCSPWQIMDFEEENRWKVETAIETYQKLGKFEATDLEITADEDNQYHYRNKVEYSFDGFAPDLKLAFHHRSSWQTHALTGCELVNPKIDVVARNILDWINKEKLEWWQLSCLTLRCNSKGVVIAGLFAKKEVTPQTWPELKDGLFGFRVFHGQSSNANNLELWHESGENFLTEDIRGVRLKHGIVSFFQINLPIFDAALADISTFLDKDKAVVDFYSGVGSISLPLRDFYKSVELVDSNPEAIMLARENIKDNGINNATAECAPSEKLLDLITADKIIIVDPPRPGLHPLVAQRFLEVLPERIIYLSCNISTQARDINLLSSEYKIKFLRLYNFFPRTPHCEALCVLEKLR